jgi:AraC-like DNA-binding protein
MKPIVEKIGLKEAKRSFHHFKRTSKRFEPYWHYHSELELTLITRGWGTRFVGNSILPYAKNDLVLLGANLPHHWVSPDDHDGNPQAAIVFQFPIDLFDPFPECETLKTFFKEAECGIHFTDPNAGLLRSIHHFDTVSKPKQIAVLLQILDALHGDDQRVYLASKSYQKPMENESNQRKIEKTTRFILENLGKKLTVHHMADMAHMVDQSFCRWFKKSVGHTFVAFLNLARIERACQLLMATDRTVQDIAFDCGFESVSHFNRTFKKIKHQSPRALRGERFR